MTEKLGKLPEKSPSNFRIVIEITMGIVLGSLFAYWLMQNMKGDINLGILHLMG